MKQQWDSPIPIAEMVVSVGKASTAIPTDSIKDPEHRFDPLPTVTDLKDSPKNSLLRKGTKGK